MKEVYAVIFKDNGKPYFFLNESLSLNVNDNVIVKTENGEQFGKIYKKNDCDNHDNLNKILRKATDKDYARYLKNKKDAELALKKAKDIANKLKLTMHFINAEFTFDRKKLVIKFSADDRIDFRNLAKKIASIYKTRIEFIQVGARDRASVCGGFGMCGKRLCCNSFLNKLESVSISMAKDQNIALNPTKINGLCGRLLCCLSYEEKQYKMLKKDLPKVGEKVKVGQKEGIVKSVDLLNRKCRVLIENNLEEIIYAEKKEI